MNTDKQYSSFTAAMADYFGKLEGQSLGDFSKELKALSPKDRQFFFDGLKANGYKFDANVTAN